MADGVAPYSLKDATELVEDALLRARPRHNRWQQLEHLFRTGQTEGAATMADIPGHLFGEDAKLTLDAINYVLPHLSMIIETVAARDPDLTVEPYSGGDAAEQRSRVGEVTLRYFWKRLKVTSRVLRDMTQDGIVLGNGFGKVGWAHTEVEVDRDPSDVTTELAEMMEADRRTAILEAEEDAAPTFTSPDELLDRISLTEAQVLADEPWVEYVSPFDIFVPDNARRMDETPWVAQRLVLPADEVRANPEFDAEALEHLNTFQMRSEDAAHRIDDGESQHGSSPFEHVELFEFYDMRTRRLMVFQRHAGQPLYEGDLPYSHRHTPFVHLRNFNDGGRRFWAFGDLENIAAIQHQFNEYVWEQMDNARRAGNKVLIDDQFFTQEMREALESDQSDVLVPVKVGNRNLTDIVHTITREGLDKDVYAAKEDLRVAMQEVLGLSDFQTGGMGADRMSATAAAVVDGTATLRAAGKREQVELAAAHLALLVLLLCQEFMDQERAIRVAGPQGVAWVNVSAADLRGEYDVRVEVGSTEAVNPSTRQQRALDMLNTVVPAMAAEGFDTTPMWRHIIRDLGYDPDQVLKTAEAPAAAPEPGAAPGGDVPHMDQLAALGGPPVPAATSGEPAL